MGNLLSNPALPFERFDLVVCDDQSLVLPVDNKTTLQKNIEQIQGRVGIVQYGYDSNQSAFVDYPQVGRVGLKVEWLRKATKEEEQRFLALDGSNSTTLRELRLAGKQIEALRTENAQIQTQYNHRLDTLMKKLDPPVYFDD